MNSPHEPAARDARKTRLFWLALLELLLMGAAVWLDVLVPSLVIILIGVLFSLFRRERLAPDGPVFRRPGKGRLILTLLGWAVVWTAVEYALILPLQNHLLAETRHVDAFAQVRGNLPALLLLLLLSWTLAAVAEEFAFRGLMRRRIISLFDNPVIGVAVAVVATSALFGLLHAEQGPVGVAVTAIDGVFFSWIRRRYQSVWASVLVHGFLNTIGLVAFYFAGPLYGLW